VTVDETPGIESLRSGFAAVEGVLAVVDLAFDQLGDLRILISIAISKALLTLLD
jgi:hypothetical protein